VDYLTETVLETETIYEGRLVRLYRATVRLPNGETSIPRSCAIPARWRWSR